GWELKVRNWSALRSFNAMVTWIGCDSDNAPLTASPPSNWVPRLTVAKELSDTPAWTAPATPIAPETASTRAVLRKLQSIVRILFVLRSIDVRDRSMRS